MAPTRKSRAEKPAVKAPKKATPSVDTKLLAQIEKAHAAAELEVKRTEDVVARAISRG